MRRAITQKDESDESYEIDDFIKQNVYVLESFKKNNPDHDQHKLNRSPNSRENSSTFIPFYKIDENATLALKKINTKLINVKKQQSNLLKPSKKIIYLTMSFLALTPGQQQIFTHDLLMNQDIQWSQVQVYLDQTNKIIQSFTKFKDLVRTRKILLLNLKSSKQYFIASNLEQTQINQQQDSIINHLKSIIPPLQNYIQESFHPSYSKNHKKQAQSMSSYTLFLKEPLKDNLIQQSEPDNQQEQQFYPTKTNQIKTVVKSVIGENQRQVSQSSRISISSNGSVSSCKKKSDLQTRILMAQQQKVSRLDKILGLRVKKPIVESVIKSQGRENSTTPRNDQKSILLEEIQKNNEEIKKIRREELNFKWQVEKEVKQLQRIQNKERESDDISRYRQMYDQKHNFKNILQNCNKANGLEKFQSNKKSERSKENKCLTIQDQIQQKQNELFVLDLKNELLNSQRTKDDLKEKLMKTIQNCYPKVQQYSENDSFQD